MGIINKKSVFYSLYIFLASRASVAGIVPFGQAAFAVAVLSYDMSNGIINIILYALACILGALTTGVWQYSVISIVVVILFTIADYFLKTTQQHDYPIVLKSAVTLVFSATVPMLILLATTNLTFMDVVNLALQAVVTFIMFFVYRIGEAAISEIIDKNTTASKSTQEELACFAAIFVIGLLGFPSVTIFGLSLKNVISIFIIMIFSLKGGIGTGAAAGIMIGIITNYSSATLICLFSFCGLLSGLMNKFKKTGVILAFSVGNVLLAAMLGATRELVHAMYETGFASIAFAVLPAQIYDFFKIPAIEESLLAKKKNFHKNNLPVRFDYAGKIRNAAMNKAKFYSETLNEMSTEFMDFAAAEKIRVLSGRKKEETCMLRVYNKVCANCKFGNRCWKQEYKLREKSFRQCEKLIEKDGDKTAEIMQILNEFCIKPDAVIDELKIAIEIKRIEKICDAKIAECRSMVVRQFGEMGKISSKIADGIKMATNYDMEMEKRIFEALTRNEIYVHDVIVINNLNEMPEITLYSKKQLNSEIISKMVGVLSKEVNRKMQLYSVAAGKKKNAMQEVKFTVKPEIKVFHGFKSLPANNNDICGDSYCFTELQDGRSFVIISDGMGTGAYAAEQSESVIRIMELYIKSGVEISSAVSTVNMLLTTKGEELTTASIDVCCIDKYNKTAGFVKMGAAPSLIVGTKNIKTIEINRPPAGISADIEEISCKMCECDITEDIAIVMFTDGVYDAFVNAGINKKVFYEYMANVVRKFNKDKSGAEKAVDEILNKVERFTQISDDMSICVIYLS